MAYISQAEKKVIAANLKNVVPKSWKYSVGVDHNSTLVLNLRSAPVDFFGILSANGKCDPDRTYMSLNHYWMDDHLKGAPADVLATMHAIMDVMNHGNHDNSDSMTDYFDVGWYVDFNIGKWDRPYVNTQEV